MGKSSLWEAIDRESGMLCRMAKEIWEKPELPLEEVFASKLQADVLTKRGFRVTLGLKGMPTGLIAEFGSGKPVIGILGEYDALSGLSQAMDDDRKVLVPGGPGHGCGHNLLGTGGVGAAIAVKEAIERGELSGTIRYYGCPAEEELMGKTFMLRDGYFDDLDAALYWHPSANNSGHRTQNLAAFSALFSFKGLSAHAPQAHLGRSALDAVELMNVGANYLREHLPKDVLLHYSILGNGIAPNSVPDKAQVWYMMRANTRETLDGAFERLKEVARGASIMTGTEFEGCEVVGCGNEAIMNGVLADVYMRNMRELGGRTFTEEDQAFGKRVSDRFTPEQKIRGAQVVHIPPEDYGLVLEHKIVPRPENAILPASGDYDVSWFVPFGMVECATWPIGVFTHTWQATACAGSSIGMNGMLFAAKTLAGTTYDLMTDPSLLERAQAEFKESTKNKTYRFAIAPDAVPRRVRL